MCFYYHNTNIEIEVGDYIKIENPYRKCKYKDKVFKISRISNTGKSIWYDDNRTNNKCKCGRCAILDTNINMSIKGIKLYQKYQEKNREIKLKLLLKEN